MHSYSIHRAELHAKTLIPNEVTKFNLAIKSEMKLNILTRRNSFRVRAVKTPHFQTCFYHTLSSHPQQGAQFSVASALSRYYSPKHESLMYSRFLDRRDTGPGCVQ